jgi:sialate O-acetylesterase
MFRVTLMYLLPIALLTLVLGMPALAEVHLPTFFSDNMVLQRDRPVPVWGKATPGETVKVTICDHTKKSVADAEGNWRVKLRPMPAGGPFEMTVTGSNTITLRNVLIGEVWFCSGQSNMVWALIDALNGPQEVAQADDPQLRFLLVPWAGALQPEPDIPATWSECTPQSALGFSAVAYFMGKELRKALGVPVGLINSSVGGSPIQAWTSRSAMATDPEMKAALATVDGLYVGHPEKTAQATRNMQEFWPALFKFYQADIRWPGEVAKAKTEGKSKPPRPVYPAAGEGVDTNLPAGLYNGMVAPLAGYGIRGAIWYQGESDAPTAKHYQKQLPLMIADWRKAWGQGDFPFLIVQIANFMAVQTEPAEKSDWALLREAQTMALSVPHIGMAVTIDVGDAKDIHPKNKQAVGQRLALAALNTVYKKRVTISGPLFKSMEITGNEARLHFKYAKGLSTRDGGPLKGFAIAGADHCFHWGDARIDGDTVVVTCAAVTNPVAVRYGWANNPVCNLQNGAKLPASPFRTDDWNEWSNAK